MALNKAEHRYTIRSSDTLFVYYIVTIIGCLLSLFVLNEGLFPAVEDPFPDPDGHQQYLQDSLDPPPVSEYKMDPLRFLLCFTGSITFAFLFEALPRSHTRVQKESREKEKLSSYDQANLFSRLMFHYVQPMMTLGAKQTLTVTDVDDPLPATLKTASNYELVSSTWERRLARYKRRHSPRLARQQRTHALKSGTSDASANPGALAVGKGPSLLLTVLDAYKWEIFPTMLLRMLSFSLLYVPIFLFSYLLEFFTDYGEALKNGIVPPAAAKGLLIAAGIFLGNVSSALFLSISSNGFTFTGIQARSALVAMIYRKSLRLSPAARSKSTLGEISNHMAVDAESWIQSTNLLPLSLTIPLEVGIAVFLLYRLIGWSLVAGLVVSAIILPVQGKMAGFLHSFQSRKLKAMDHRLRLMSEMLSNIKIIKLSSWEDPFRKKIDILRDNELKAQKVQAIVESFLSLVFSSVSLIIVLATYTVYANWGGPGFTPAKMTPEVIFVGITLFTMLGRSLGLASMAISHLISLRNANGRIQKFLLLEEMDTSTVNRHGRQKPDTKDASTSPDGKLLAVEIENGTFAWDKASDSSVAAERAGTELLQAQGERQPLLAASLPSSTLRLPSRPVLSNINLKIPEGNLTAIVGRVGQGKSSLLSAVIGDMYKHQGTVTVYGSLAYAPQQPWIINASIRDNIVFGKTFDQEKYDHIVFASGLVPDFQMLPAGDQTEIGERGINLSGGQKQRVSLARAAYQDADIYLLDDPLSAVDAHVDQHLWKYLIGPDGLLRQKTRLLITHGIHHLEEVDQIVVVKDGMISETGEYRELMRAKDAFYQLISEFSAQEKKAQQEQHQNEDNNTLKHVKPAKGKNANKGQQVAPEDVTTGQAGAATKDKAVGGSLVGAEKVVEGRVGWGVYLDYVDAISIRNAVLCLFLYALGQVCQLSTSFWLRYWVTADEREESRSIAFYLVGYALLIVIFLMVDIAISYMTAVVCGIKGSKTLYDRLLTRVLRMPMSFFDTTPMGRIMNRFSSDISAVDSRIPYELPGLLSFIAMTLSILLVTAYSTPLFLLAVPPLGFVFFTIQGYYVKTSGQLKRFQSVSKSPLYQHFSESLAGVSTIRCMDGFVSFFITENEKRSDQMGQRTHLFFLTNRWLTIRIQTLCATTVFLAAALAVVNADKLDPSLVGLSLSYALNLTNIVAILIRTLSEVQNQFVSVERIQEYSQIPIEAPLETGVRLPKNWPEHGRIEFKEFSARYREGLELCIKDASFTIEPQEKLGVVGRTGAGKSSLTLALFRIIEAADSYWAHASGPTYSEEHPLLDTSALYSDSHGTEGGSITIDGIDISTIGLRDLRRSLSIIPQDPTLFAGTLRDNLDPFHELEDAALWEALERAHLKDHISTLAGGLSFEVAQNGENFSLGQRSLICLARALLRKSKILVLDEATSAVDVETDDLIQKTIRKEFKDRTIITIAHRIKTVMDSDKILVLDHGRVHEFDTPKVLLHRRDSLFYGLAYQAGEI
ncbi:Multidrug resistance-associated protein 1 [Dissophora globulifera]|uniref:Multidrug resistance-associated protein 1 n=1 Tax=Dissophora globulifera TaxID=979702 RepID=A0A9P6UPB6_9FUNG|nr:Multidrug resistance-associated protein 1 [Dissophora globulifera]